MAQFGRSNPSVVLKDSEFNPAEKVLEWTYGNGKYKFKLTKVKAKMVLHCLALIQDFVKSSDNGDWTNTDRHFAVQGVPPTVPGGTTQTSVSGRLSQAIAPFAEVERVMGGEEIKPPETKKTEKHGAEISTTDSQVTFK